MKRAVFVAALLLACALTLVACGPKEPTLGETSRLQTLVNAAVTTTTGTELSMVGKESAVVYVSSSVTATVTFYGTVDGSNWVAIALQDLNSATRARSTTATASKLMFLENTGGLSSFRPDVTSWTSGTVTVKARSY